MHWGDRINYAVQRSIDAYPVPWLFASALVIIIVAMQLFWIVTT